MSTSRAILLLYNGRSCCGPVKLPHRAKQVWGCFTACAEQSGSGRWGRLGASFVCLRLTLVLTYSSDILQVGVSVSVGAAFCALRVVCNQVVVLLICMGTWLGV